jgi:antirestriction protein ArdC
MRLKKELQNSYDAHRVYDAIQSVTLSWELAVSAAFNPTQKLSGDLLALMEATRSRVVRNDNIAYMWGFKGAYSRYDDLIEIAPILLSSELEILHVIVHELAHSTGHKSRLNREGITEPRRFAYSYSQEETTAELAAMFVFRELGALSSEQYTQSLVYMKMHILPTYELFFEAWNDAIAAAEWILNTYCNREEMKEAV